MAGKKRSSGGLPAVVIAVAGHVIADLVTEAACPTCNQRVVLYVCLNCKKIVSPRRRGLPGSG